MTRALLMVFLAWGCSAPPPVRPMLPRRAAPMPDVEALLSPLRPSPAPPLSGRIQAAYDALHARAPEETRWMPAEWSTPQPRFVWWDGLARNFEPVRALCAEAVDEALPEGALPCPDLVEALVDVGQAQRALESMPRPLDETELKTLQAALLAAGLRGALDRDGALRPRVIDAQFPGPKRATTPSLVRAWVALREVRDEALAALELHAYRVLLAYAWQTRGRWAEQTWEQVRQGHKWVEGIDRARARRGGREYGGRAYPADWPATADAAPAAAMRAAFRRITSTPAADVIRWLRPAGGQYDRLRAAHRRYRQIAEAGGFVKVPALDGVRPKRRHKGIRALRARLAQEGYVAPPVNPTAPDVYDAHIEQAVVDYQSAHLLQSRKRRVGPKTQRLLREPATLKLARIAAALELWRQVVPRPDYYVQVNIPDYHVEVWHKAKRLERIRVVVGSGKRKWEKGKATRPNATPTMAAEIRTVVYNPYWNIPQRILEEEVLEESLREAEPEAQIAWLEEKGYEVMNPGGRWQYARQLPGKENPLGRVKILFPNEHDVYLHDTPAKALFRNPVRAYSHGCMRVHQPLRLARRLLERDGRYDPQAIRRWLRKDEPTAVRLEEPVPIFVEYIPVRVDDDGRTWFLKDIYKMVELRTADAR